MLRAVSEPTERHSAPSRPASVGLALIVATLVGLHTAHEGYTVLELLRDPLRADALGLPEEVRAALVESVMVHGNVTLPIGLAQLLLGGLLFVSALIAWLGSRGAVSLVLQALFANALLLGVAYFLREPIRAALVEALVASPGFEQEFAARVDESARALSYSWGLRLGSILQFAALATCGWLLLRPAARLHRVASVSEPPK